MSRQQIWKSNLDIARLVSMALAQIGVFWGDDGLPPRRYNLDGGVTGGKVIFTMNLPKEESFKAEVYLKLLHILRGEEEPAYTCQRVKFLSVPYRDDVSENSPISVVFENWENSGRNLTNVINLQLHRHPLLIYQLISEWLDPRLAEDMGFNFKKQKYPSAERDGSNVVLNYSCFKENKVSNICLIYDEGLLLTGAKIYGRDEVIVFVRDPLRARWHRQFN